METSCDLLLQLREKVQIPSKSKYLSGLPSIIPGVRGFPNTLKLIKENALKCGADNSSILRGTFLGKNFSTMGTELNVT